MWEHDYSNTTERMSRIDQEEEKKMTLSKWNICDKYLLSRASEKETDKRNNGWKEVKKTVKGEQSEDL